jgi:hypothetical protein
MGMALTFFVFSLQVPITPFHLIGFWLYGIILSLALVLGGATICGIIFGKEKVAAILGGGAPAEDSSAKKNK